MPSAGWWKEFYAAERESLGMSGMEAFFQTLLSLPRGGAGGEVEPASGAIIFPHTRLSISGAQTAAAARAVIESGCDTVLAIGVLHAGDKRGDIGLRGIRGPGAPHDTGIWRDEFSLDNFEEMLGIAANLFGKPKPTVIQRYPFLTGSEPESLPGLDELRLILSDGAALVATADMIHHGAGYGTPVELQRDRNDPSTLAWSRDSIQSTLEKLSRKYFTGLLSDCETMRSDFRDGGPLLATLLSNFASTILDLQLVDYSEVLETEEPTWVAAALVEATVRGGVEISGKFAP